MTQTYLRYYDSRFGDVYEVYTDHEGEFITACRSLDAFGRSPIYYDSLDDIPALHRGAIEQLLAERQKQK